MANFQSEVQKLVDGFVAQLAELWRRQAIDSLTGLGGGRGTGRVTSGAAPAPTTMTLSRGRGRGAKRTADELDQLAD
ncbi:MAG TPA: hypothetical protein VK427_06280, partial [Kofleriaceae bacterium]|nr:hypothetical protein [Kofleriaceae bacterium]